MIKYNFTEPEHSVDRKDHAPTDARRYKTIYLDRATNLKTLKCPNCANQVHAHNFSLLYWAFRERNKKCAVCKVPIKGNLWPNLKSFLIFCFFMLIEAAIFELYKQIRDPHTTNSSWVEIIEALKFSIIIVINLYVLLLSFEFPAKYLGYVHFVQGDDDNAM